MKQEYISEIKAIILLALGMILLASLVSFVPEDLPWYTSHPNVPAHNLIRVTGAYMAGALLFVLGYSAYAFVLFLFFWSWNKFMVKDIRFSFSKIIGFSILLCVMSSLLAMPGVMESSLRFQMGGIAGLFISDFLTKNVGWGAYIILMMLGTLSLIVTCEFLVSPIFLKIVEKFFQWGGRVKEKVQEGKADLSLLKSKMNLERDLRERENVLEKNVKNNLKLRGEGAIEKRNKKDAEKALLDDLDLDPSAGKQAASATLASKPKIRIAPIENKGVGEGTDEGEAKIVGEYHLPPLDLLENPPQISTDRIQNDLISGAKLLEETLASFGVSARVADIERGPAITRYELEPGPGVKVQKFTTLSDDIALAMKAAAVRVVAPIPGKNRVGIEVPNGASAAVFLKDVLTNSQFRSSASKLSLALGKDIAGQPMVADLAEMPHLLIAGTTGSGKTVCVNGIITSMLFNATPEEVKFVMVDPKMVELAQYNDIPHLLCPTVTDTQKAAGVLNWVVSEMENRYRKLSKEGVRNIKGYNARGHKMPYIVVIIDELADLMQVSAKTVESSITRLAQLSRAVGIHLILATQRPSVDVITGVIKANFPARISFKVASKVDSRTVLDMNGAENLLGKGDMLFIKPGDAKPTRGQCSYVKDEEIHRVIQYIKEQQTPVYDENILIHQKPGAKPGSDEKDEYYDEAVKLVIETQQASVSILQRRLRLGYTRAARLIDMMEQNGIVGPYCGSKPRDILVDREKWLLENMKTEEVKE
ncbi:MAG TPA: cell division protein FtsK [Candidatus Omnitrophica bacterium]|nr:MAG: hypothetical protein A2Z81_03905 [Omnitrophica WOR_2 bacterium GWA2_45_18]OGX18922.1 MAG: hypothetical protein A2Y04_00020 [Omnitrophica WOR_2 bacterium GWC2_45_7]HBR14771.1 cell division protein FtsK [Candidatus Omnitrophota bacterium]